MQFTDSSGDRLPIIYLVGDSTAEIAVEDVMEQPDWQAAFPLFFDSSQVRVVTAAVAPHSARTFQTEGLWQTIKDSLKPGDVVILQFGRKDYSSRHTTDLAYTLPGIGPETQNILAGSPPKEEVIHTYGWYMRKYLRDTRSSGAIPILLSWPGLDASSGSGFSPLSPHYAEWALLVAEQEERTSHLDLAPIFVRGFEQASRIAPDEAAPSASLIARCIVGGLKSLLDGPVSRYLSPLGLQALSATELSFKSLGNPNLPTLWVIGDSTVRNGDGVGRGGMWGWGDLLAHHLRPGRINVVNRAVSGRSSRTYYTMHWLHLLPRLRPGDLVLMQFGHNDGGAPDNKQRARAPLPGIGSECLLIANPITGLPEDVHTYGWYLRKMIGEARGAGAMPIVCTLVPQLIWSGEEIVREIFAEWAATVASEERTLLIDLNTQVAERYEELGVATAAGLFAQPPAHTNLEGAHLTAKIAIESLRALELPYDPLL